MSSSLMQKVGILPRLVQNQCKSSRAFLRSNKSDDQLLNGRRGLEVSTFVKSHNAVDVVQPTRAPCLLLEMDERGKIPHLEMYRSLLKACEKKKVLTQAKQVLAHLTKHGLESTNSLGEAVVRTLVKCGGLDEAVKFIYKLQRQTVISWTAIISGYVMSGQGRQALDMYQRMQENGVQPNVYTFVSLLKACSSLCDLEEGKRIHTEAVKYRCVDDVLVGTCLVDMYGKCGSTVNAQNVFDTLSKPDVVSWTALLAAYTQQSQPDKALLVYDLMKERGVSPNDRTLVNALQACSMLAEMEEESTLHGQPMKVMSLGRGKALHADIWRKGYTSDLFVGSSLISMYSQCCSIQDVHDVFDKLPQRDVVIWNTVILAHVEQRHNAKALLLYRRMQEEGVTPNYGTVLCALQACAVLAEMEDDVLVCGQFIKVKSLEQGKALHAYAVRKGYDSDVCVGSRLITTYGKCGSVTDAHCKFAEMWRRDVITWNVMLAAFARNQQGEKVFQMYEQMQDQGVSPNDHTFVNLLHTCGMLAEKNDQAGCVQFELLGKGRAVHASIRRKGLDSDSFVADALVSMYGKCGSLTDARIVFDGLTQPDVVSWTSLIAAYIERGRGEDVFHLYQEMREEGVTPDERALVVLLQACGMLAAEENGEGIKVKSLARGKAVLAYAWMKGCDSDVYVSSTLVSMYAKCGSLVDAGNALGMLSSKSVVAWTALIAGYVDQGQSEKALRLYEQMQEEGVSPDARTFVSVLQACGMLSEREDRSLDGQLAKFRLLAIGKIIHAHAREKHCASDSFVSNTLVSMYGKCGSVVDAKNVFDLVSEPRVLARNAMLAAYVEQGQVDEALGFYEQMQHEQVSPDARTFVSMLHACSLIAEKDASMFADGQSIRAHCLQKVRALHAHAQRKGHASDVFVGNTLVSMYGKCGNIKDAEIVFDGLSHRNIVSWNTMLVSYVEDYQGERAVQLYHEMKQEGVSADDITLVCILRACSATGNLALLRWVHQTPAVGRSNLSSFLASSLIYAYGSCASMVEAQGVFDALLQPEIVCWTALISGYVRQGSWQTIMELFDKMLLAGVKPNAVTFSSLITACSHVGLVDRGVEYFESMSRDYGIAPELEHYVSVVDLLGRAGCFATIEELLSKMPMQPNLSMWLCLLAACRRHGQVVLAEETFLRAVCLQPMHSAAYLLMSNIYTDAGQLNRATEVMALRQLKEGFWKKPGRSWIEHNQDVHPFSVGGCHDEKLYDLLENVNVKVE